MELKALFPNLIGTWVRWSDYEIRSISNTPYIIPTQNAVELPYSYADQTSELVADALNLGKHLYNDDFVVEYYVRRHENNPEDQQKNRVSEKKLLDFARKYGLLGVVKQGSPGRLFSSDTISPMHQGPGSKRYGEEATTHSAVFVSLYLHLIYARGELPEEMDEYTRVHLSYMTEKALPCGMVYRLASGQPPQLVWQPDSLESILRLAYSLAVTDPAQPLKVCKNCGKVYHNPHQKSEFCSVKCRNYYNVQVFRGRGKPESEKIIAFE